MVSESTHVTQQRGERPFAAVSSAPPAASGGDDVCGPKEAAGVAVEAEPTEVMIFESPTEILNI